MATDEERHLAKEVALGANTKSSSRPRSRGARRKRAEKFGLGATARTGVSTTYGYASPRESTIAHARALLIYLKHRGVLNIDEFRRSKSLAPGGADAS